MPPPTARSSPAPRGSRAPAPGAPLLEHAYLFHVLSSMDPALDRRRFFDACGRPVMGATVTWTDDEGGLRQTATTDGAGAFHLTGPDYEGEVEMLQHGFDHIRGTVGKRQ